MEVSWLSSALAGESRKRKRFLQNRSKARGISARKKKRRRTEAVEDGVRWSWRVSGSC
jgi:hypothetical protein